MAKQKKEVVESEVVETATETKEVVESGLVSIKRIASGVYHGFDGKDPVENALTVKSGDLVSVSADKADQLLQDFPTDWELA